MLQPCSVCISIGSTAEVTIQTENSTTELNVTCTPEESKKYIETSNCSVLKLHQYETLPYIEVGCGSYWCHIVIPLERLDCCTVKSTSNKGQSDSQCVAQITSTRVLPSITSSAQNNSAGLTGATTEPTPSVPSSIASPSITPVTHSWVQTPSVPSARSTPPSNLTACLDGVSCIVYLAVGLGALAVIVVLLVAVIIVLVCISVMRRKKKMRGERECILLCLLVTKVCCIMYYCVSFVKVLRRPLKRSCTLMMLSHNP